MSTVIPVDQHDVMLRRAIAWAACVEGAVSGQRGHDRFYRVVCKLLHMPPFGFGLTVAQALPIIDRYNATCQPPFSEREKQHKIFDAAKSPRARH